MYGKPHAKIPLTLFFVASRDNVWTSIPNQTCIQIDTIQNLMCAASAVLARSVRRLSFASCKQCYHKGLPSSNSPDQTDNPSTTKMRQPSRRLTLCLRLHSFSLLPLSGIADGLACVHSNPDANPPSKVMFSNKHLGVFKV